VDRRERIARRQDISLDRRLVRRLRRGLVYRRLYRMLGMRLSTSSDRRLGRSSKVT
jgi:hypothetical protein